MNQVSHVTHRNSGFLEERFSLYAAGGDGPPIKLRPDGLISLCN